MNIFEEILHRLSSKTRMRALFKDVNVEDLERIINRIKLIVEEKNQAKVELELNRKEKMQSVEEIREVMRSKGISLSDFEMLNTPSKNGKKKRNVSKHTFEYQTPVGDTVTWYGAATGRLPKEFQDYLNRTGKKRADCIIGD